jgi:hypothetical protein
MRSVKYVNLQVWEVGNIHGVLNFYLRKLVEKCVSIIFIKELKLIT